MYNGHMGRAGNGGGTSVGGSPPGLKLGGLVLVIGLIAFALFWSKGGDEGTNDSATAEVGDSDEDEDEDEPGAVDEGEDEMDPGQEERDETAPSPAQPESDPSGDDAPGQDELLAALRSSDGLAAARAQIELKNRELQNLAIPVLWDMAKNGDRSQLRQAKDFLDNWSVPQTFDRSIVFEEERPKDKPEWLEASVEVDGSELVFEMTYWYGAELFGSPKPPWIELSARGGTLAEPAIKKLEPEEGENELRTILAAGVGPGTYEISILLWGQNKNTQTQHNVGGPVLTVVKP